MMLIVNWAVQSTIFFIKSQILLSRVHTLIRDSKKAQLQG